MHETYFSHVPVHVSIGQKQSRQLVLNLDLHIYFMARNLQIFSSCQICFQFDKVLNYQFHAVEIYIIDQFCILVQFYTQQVSQFNCKNPYYREQNNKGNGAFILVKINQSKHTEGYCKHPVWINFPQLALGNISVQHYITIKNIALSSKSNVHYLSFQHKHKGISYNYVAHQWKDNTCYLCFQHNHKGISNNNITSE